MSGFRYQAPSVSGGSGETPVYVLAGTDFDFPTGITAVSGVPVGYKVLNDRVQMFGGIVVADGTDLDGLASAIVQVKTAHYPLGDRELPVYSGKGIVDAYLYDNGGTDDPLTGLWLQNTIIDGTARVARPSGDNTVWLDNFGYELVTP